MKVLLAVIALLVLATGAQTYRLMSLEVVHAEYVAQIQGEARIAESVARQTEQRHQAAIDQIRDKAHDQKTLDDAHAVELAAVGDSLRKQTGGLLADRAALHTRLAQRGKTIEELTDLLAQLRAEADDHAGQLATALDAGRRAGFACESSYDALMGR
jgi:hypothetical protein